MTNDEMWQLIRYRIRGFYERVILPFAMYETGDIELAEEYLCFQFNSSPSPHDWINNFFKGVEETETTIALHMREIKSFRNEISNSLKYVPQSSFVDAFNITTYPPFSTNKTKRL